MGIGKPINSGDMTSFYPPYTPIGGRQTPGGGAPPAATFYLLKEDGDALLKEDGDHILKEDAP